MKKILFITESYYPNHTAVSNCVANIAIELEEKYEVSILCLNEINSNRLDKYRQHNIFRIKSLEERKSSFLNQVKRGLKRVLSKNSLDEALINTFYQEMMSNEYLKDIDYIIPSAMPYESVAAAIKFKKYSNTKCEIIPYLFDQFTENDNFHRFKSIKYIKYNFHRNFEKQLIRNSKYILLMHSLKHHYMKHFFEDKKKFIFVEHPLLVAEKKQDIKLNFNKKKYQFSYVGGLYKSYVEANYLLKVFEQYKTTQDNFCINFYVMGNATQIISEYQKKYPDNFINHGRKSKDEVTVVRNSSDILISISEKSGRQLSSKIFEYISTGKPIIHFYNKDEDVNINILKKYPNCLLIKEDFNNINNEVNNILNFLREINDKTIKFCILENIFADAKPSHTGNILSDIIEN